MPRGHVDHTDNELLARVTGKGDQQALAVLFSRYQHLVFGVCMKYLGNAEDSKDAVMDIFEKLSTQLEKQNVTNFKAWLYVITKNHALMRLRSAKTSVAGRTVEMAPEHVVEIEDKWHPLFEDHAGQRLEWLQECLKTLPPDQEECIRLFYIERKSYKELVSERMDTMNKVKSHIQNGRRNLKNCIELKKERDING